MTELPAPLTPPDCNLRGFQWMPIDTVRLLDSDLFLLASGDEFKAALALWCKSWSQVPAASLPSNELLLAGLSGAKNWKKVRDVAMRGWIMCSDGRWYHPVVAEKALEAMVMAKAHAEQKAAASERKAQERMDRSRMFGLLREHGIVADYHTSTSKLREMVSGMPPPNNESSQHVTRDESQPVTAKTGQDTTKPEQTVLKSSVPNGTGAAAPELPPARTAKQEVWATGYSLLEGAKVPETQARSFLGLLVADYTIEILLQAVRIAAAEQPVDPIGFLKATCQRLKGERAPPWWLTEETILAKAKEIGVKTIPGEQMAQFKIRVQAAIDAGAVPPVAKDPAPVDQPALAVVRSKKPEGVGALKDLTRKVVP